MQVVHAGVSWKQCADLPITLSWASAVVVSGKVYCGGGFTESDDSDYLIFSYDPSQDSWTSLPPLPVKWFGLGQVNGKLVTVGGWDKHVEKRTNKVYTYEQSKKWKQTIPPMPTARNSASVESLTLGLVVAGGCIHNACVNVVEVFKSDTSQWYSASPLPTACCHTSLTSIGDTIYALGGYSHPSHLNQAHFVSFDHLLENAELSTPTPSSHGHSDARTVWKPLPKTSSYEVAATSLVGNLMILGGRESPEGMDSTRQVYIHSSSTDSWIYISDLPASRAGTAVAVLSATEVIVIGGWCYGKVNTVYKGTLHLNV